MPNFELNYTGLEVNELLAKAGTSLQEGYHDNTKQDTITDLATIRSGAGLGATALQSVPDTYATKTYVTTQGYAKTSDLLEKSTEQWQFTLADGSTVDKTIVLGA